MLFGVQRKLRLVTHLFDYVCSRYLGFIYSGDRSKAAEDNDDESFFSAFIRKCRFTTQVRVRGESTVTIADRKSCPPYAPILTRMDPSTSLCSLHSKVASTRSLRATYLDARQGHQCHKVIIRRAILR